MMWLTVVLIVFFFAAIVIFRHSLLGIKVELLNCKHYYSCFQAEWKKGIKPDYSSVSAVVAHLNALESKLIQLKFLYVKLRRNCTKLDIVFGDVQELRSELEEIC